MIKLKKPLCRIIQEGGKGDCELCHSTLQYRFNILGLFHFGKVLGCHNIECENYYFIKELNQ